MMIKRAKMLICLFELLSISYIMAMEIYDMHGHKIETLSKQLESQGIDYTEVEISLSGICYDQNLSKEEMHTMNNEMIKELSHEEECSKLCCVPHCTLAQTSYDEQGKVKQIETNDSGLDWAYELIIKDQEDFHQNAYYTLNLSGKNMAHLDTLRNRGIAQLKKWHVSPKESICFRGLIDGKLTKKEERQIRDGLFKNLKANRTGYYEDDREASTCAFYGYTNEIDEYIRDAKGKKCNVQLSFSFNEEMGQTELLAAFPFTNTPF